MNERFEELSPKPIRGHLMRFLLYAFTLGLLFSTLGWTEGTRTRVIDDFNTGNLSRWQSSMSPAYYKGGAGHKGLEIVQDPERGKVLRCNVRFVNPELSEPAFITRRLKQQPHKRDVTRVRFWAKLTGPSIAPEGGFKVRLRTADTAFTDYDVQEQLGRPFPAGQWVHVDLDAALGPNVRNVWNSIWGDVRQMTFRLDDVDDKNTEFALLLDDLELVTRQPAEQTVYTPQVRPRPKDRRTRILFLKHRAAGYYGLEAAIRAAEPAAEIDRFDYRGYHFEFFGFPGSRGAVLAYDLIIMLDVDPIMMSYDQCAWIADAVASGSQLLFLAGPVTLGHAKDFKSPLRAVLPVTFKSGQRDIRVSMPPVPLAHHFLNTGLDPTGLGKVGAVQALRAEPGAEVPWTVSSHPLVITMPVGRGRATVVNTWPQVSRTATGDFFTSSLSDDLLRQLIHYGLGRTTGPRITRLILPALSRIGGGKAVVELTAPGGELSDLRLILDGQEQVTGEKLRGGTFRFTLNLPAPASSEESHQVRIERMFKGEVADARDFEIKVQHPFQLEVAWARDKYTFAPGSRVEIEAVVRPRKREQGAASDAAEIGSSRSFTLSARLKDFRSNSTWNLPSVEKKPGFSRFAGPLPLLAAGPYELEVSAWRGTAKVVKTSSHCIVVDSLDLSNLFPIMSIVGIAGDGHYLAESGIEQRVDDLLEHGFNTAAITGLSNFRTGKPSNAQRLKAYAESYAQQRGMATTYEYSNFKLMNRRGKTVPCVFDPKYPAALAQRLEWQIDVGNRTPRLISAKIVDEPHFGVKNMDGCQFCRKEFRKRYGIDLDLSKGENLEGAYSRWATADFISQYVSHGYAESVAAMKRNRANFDLLLTFDSGGLGYQRPLHSQQDVFEWSRYVKWADFDVYPYFYPKSQRIRMVQTGFAMACLRDVARARGIPWGFYIELDDRNWPFQKNPKEATAECAFTAVARGAGYLNSFIHRLVGTGTQSRPERWETAGRALRSIRRIGPVLKKMSSERANLALLFPNTQQAITNGYPAPDYAFAALQAGFGEIDILTEKTVLEKKAIPYPALVLLGAKYVHEEFVPLLTSWLRQGGILLCDRLPSRTHRGASISWSFDAVIPSFPEDSGQVVHSSLRPVGKGRMVFLGNDVNEAFRERVEAKRIRPEQVASFRRALARTIPAEITPNVRVHYRETARSVDLIEAGLRDNRDAILLTVVNHQPEEQRVSVELAPRGIGWLCDTVTMKEIPFRRKTDGRIAVSLKVQGRWARLLAGYREKPRRLTIQIPTEKVRRGDMLEYRVAVSGRRGRLLSGGLIIEIEARDPEGRIVSRLGGSFAPVAGEQRITIPVPINTMPGRYTLHARAPQAALESKASFEVTR